MLYRGHRGLSFTKKYIGIYFALPVQSNCYDCSIRVYVVTILLEYYIYTYIKYICQHVSNQ